MADEEWHEVSSKKNRKKKNDSNERDSYQNTQPIYRNNLSSRSSVRDNSTQENQKLNVASGTSSSRASNNIPSNVTNNAPQPLVTKPFAWGQIPKSNQSGQSIQSSIETQSVRSSDNPVKNTVISVASNAAAFNEPQKEHFYEEENEDVEEEDPLKHEIAAVNNDNIKFYEDLGSAWKKGKKIGQKPQAPLKAERIQELDPDKEYKVEYSILSQELNSYPLKPAEPCTLGREIIVLANHYGIQLKSSFILNQYDVSIFSCYKDYRTQQVIQTEVKGKEVAKWMFTKLLEKYPEHQNKMFYDNRKILLSISQLPEELQMSIDLPNLKKQLLVKIKKVKDMKIDPTDLMSPTALQALHLLFTHNLNRRCVSVSRSFFTQNCERKKLGINIDLWKGFYLAIRPSKSGFNANIDVANKVFFNNSNIIDIACEVYKCGPEMLLNKIRADKNGKRLADQLREKKIRTHLNISKKFEGIGPTALEHKFKAKDVEMTINEYFQKQGKKLKYPELPCIDLGNKNFTPMELCKAELVNIKKFNPNERKSMIDASAVPSLQRKKNIDDSVQNINLNADPILKNYNIHMEYTMANIKARVLQAPDLELGNKMITQSAQIGTSGKWDYFNKRFLDAKTLNRWIVIDTVNCGNHNLDTFLRVLKTTANEHGIVIREPLLIQFSGHYTNEADALKCFTSYVDRITNLQLILAILPESSIMYNALKTVGDLKRGICTQAVKYDTLSKNEQRMKRSVSNICLKINAKLGGKNFKLSRNDRLFQTHLQDLYNGPVMILGADVNHPSPVDKGTTESIAAVVGSIDLDCCYYAARMQAQKQPKGKSLELIIDLKNMVKELLEEYYKALKRFPKRILYLRDGVSEGQFKAIRDNELHQIRTACQNIQTSYKPGITFVLVQKRHHTRFFPYDAKDQSGKHLNVPPGTLVDTKIISPDMFDFFLCSHMGIQGTSKPCHYFVLHDDNNFSMNQIALLCHYLCHIYSRSTTSVSYPAPTYYADLCAARGRDYIRERIPEDVTKHTSSKIEIHEFFRNKMFFM